MADEVDDDEDWLDRFVDDGINEEDGIDRGAAFIAV
jgi:hypothetical protein